MSLSTLRKLNPGLPMRFVDDEEAQDWLPFGCTDEQAAAKQAEDPSTYTEWAVRYNAWEAKGTDV